MNKQAYWEGYLETCQAMGVDPSMLKQAGLGEWLGQQYRKTRSMFGYESPKPHKVSRRTGRILGSQSQATIPQYVDQHGVPSRQGPGALASLLGAKQPKTPFSVMLPGDGGVGKTGDIIGSEGPTGSQAGIGSLISTTRPSPR
jgi:hypothetical protein